MGERTPRGLFLQQHTIPAVWTQEECATVCFDPVVRARFSVLLQTVNQNGITVKAKCVIAAHGRLTLEGPRGCVGPH